MKAMNENINDNYILIEEIKGNKDLHEIAKKIHFEDGMGYLPKTTTRKQFIDEIIGEINWQLEMSNPSVPKNVLTEELKKMIKIAEKEEKKQERSR